MKNLIINADDFGMSKEINSGTILGIKHGVISSVSVMVNMPYFEEAVNFLKKHPRVSVGLHFNITEGKSILIPRDVGSLLREDNSFFFWPFLGQQILFKNIKLIEIQAELKAQFTKLSKTGLTITHIDSHHHIHLVPRIFKVISNFANQQKQVTLRGNEFDLWNLTIGIMKKPIPTQIIVNLMLLLNNLKNKKHNLYSAQRFYDLNWGKNFSIKEFELVLKNLPEGTTEFICH
ncbi:MAG: ChbG/HpnK family deacetylase, partial [Patescibacteria group bacterium]|nr:ChbG/HpnK family deacetylase [Patescibacteria group bacterium]